MIKQESICGKYTLTLPVIVNDIFCHYLRTSICCMSLHGGGSCLNGKTFVKNLRRPSLKESTFRRRVSYSFQYVQRPNRVCFYRKLEVVIKLRFSMMRMMNTSQIIHFSRPYVFNDVIDETCVRNITNNYCGPWNNGICIPRQPYYIIPIRQQRTRQISTILPSYTSYESRLQLIHLAYDVLTYL